MPDWIRSPRSPRRQGHQPWFVRYLIAVVTSGVLVAAVSAAGLVAAGRLSEAATTGKAEPIVLSPLATRSLIFDRNGAEIAVLYGDEDREEIPIDRIPKLVQDAVLGVEDRDFYQHKGFNARSALRALFANLEAGDIEQGGSTITQQLIKNSIVGSEQTFERKAREAVLAMHLENQMSKKEILERYLNTVYLGNGAYGVQAFAETYFGKSAEDLGWAEAALMTALIRNPNGYDPIRHPETAKRRRALVVDVLLDGGLIDEQQAKEIKEAPLPTERHKRSSTSLAAQLAGADYFTETVKQQLLDLPELGATSTDRYNAVFKGGLRVTTTYDPRAQELAEKAVETLPSNDDRFAVALASVEPGTGAVRALVGGMDFAEQKFNYATQGWRQPGSSFKFFTLMAAFENEVVPNDTISGSSPCRFDDPTAEGGVYTARNSGGGGKTSTITSQTTSSSNCAFLRLAQYVGLDKVAAMANEMGITTLNQEGVGADQRIVEGPVPSNILSMPIGSKEVHPLSMAAAYATAANDGVFHRPYFIEKVTDSNGNVIYEHSDGGKQVVSAQTARLVTEVLSKNAESGTGRRAKLSDQPSAGKTGTTQENADVWYVGYTPYLSTAVWIGSPKNRDPVRINGRIQYGADYPARIWHEFMEPFHAELAEKPFIEPASTRKGKYLRVDSSGKKDSSSSSSTRRRSTSRSTVTTAPSRDEGRTPPSNQQPDAPTPPSGPSGGGRNGDSGGGGNGGGGPGGGGPGGGGNAGGGDSGGAGGGGGGDD